MVVLGPTNAGKSTLVNAIVGEKVSIVSPRPQTTYHGVRGILSLPDAQIIFTDTPGLQNYRSSVAKLLRRVALRNAGEADLCLWVFDVSEDSFRKKLWHTIDTIRQSPPERTILCLNKCDRIAKPKLLPIMAELHAQGLFRVVIPVSARRKDGIDAIVREIIPILPEGEPLFPKDMRSDRGLQYWLTEWVREQAYHFLREELPYSLWVELEEWRESEKGIEARATIHVDSRSKKGIVIGKGGSKLKEIGSGARKELQKKTGRKVSLFLNVHCDPDWQRNRNRVSRYLEL